MQLFLDLHSLKLLRWMEGRGGEDRREGRGGVVVFLGDRICFYLLFVCHSRYLGSSVLLFLHVFFDFHCWIFALALFG
jgi:hypothetical protein